MDRWNIRKYKLIFVTYFGLWTYIAIDGARRVGLIRDPRLIFFPIGETRSKLTDPNMNNQGKGYLTSSSRYLLSLAPSLNIEKPNRTFFALL